MASGQEILTNSSVGSFNDPFDASYHFQEIPKDYTAIDSVWGKLGNALGLVDRNQYERWLTAQNIAYERAGVKSDRAWNEYLENTKYQRMVEDLKKAGINPYYALNSGSVSPVSSSSAQGVYSTKGKASSSSSDLKGLIATAFLLLKLLA